MADWVWIIVLITLTVLVIGGIFKGKSRTEYRPLPDYDDEPPTPTPSPPLFISSQEQVDEYDRKKGGTTMKHARSDYDRIQDPFGLIPEEEPVFLLRAQDCAAPATVIDWVMRAEQAGAGEVILKAAREQAEKMKAWQRDHGMKIPDMPGGSEILTS